MRRETPAYLTELVADVDAREAACERLRFEHDHGYRRRKAAYLRGDLDRAQLLAGESHSQWLKRWRDAAR